MTQAQHGTWEPVVSCKAINPVGTKQAPKQVGSGLQQEKLQAIEIARTKVLMRGTGADRLVVVMKSGNADGAKESNYSAIVYGQLKRRSH